MPKPITRQTSLGEVTEYFDEPEKHGFEPEKPAEPPVNPDDLGATGE